ncbi:MAG: hypothetical protein ACR2PL_19890 [Dehalococcoidia bacterium]
MTTENSPMAEAEYVLHLHHLKLRVWRDRYHSAIWELQAIAAADARERADRAKAEVISTREGLDSAKTALRNACAPCREIAAVRTWPRGCPRHHRLLTRS